MIGDLKVAIHEKQKGEDFKKEYAVSNMNAHFKRVSVNPKVIRYSIMIYVGFFLSDIEKCKSLNFKP